MQRGVRKRLILDPFLLSEMLAYRWCLPDTVFCFLFPGLATKVQHARNALGTYENFRSSMDEAGVGRSVCMPIPPYVTFEDLLPVHEKDPTIIPFTGIDFTRKYDLAASLARDVERGARGIKLHPIIQRVSLDSGKTFEAVDAFASHGLPVLFHCGVTSYFYGPDRRREVPHYGNVSHAAELVRAFPKVNFIAGHAGLEEVNDVVSALSKFSNAYVDISFQSPRIIKGLMQAFGPERVLFASDWPWGSRHASMRAVRAACNGDKRIEERIFCSNAASLMNISPDG